MKTRFGFVSNSSSSSFMISVSNETNGKLTIPIEIDLEDYKYAEIHTVEELDTHYKEEYGDRLSWSHETMCEYESAVKAITSGNRIIFGLVTDETGDPIQSFLRGANLNDLIPKNLKKKIKVIYQC